MRKCCVCQRCLVPLNEGMDHIGLDPSTFDRIVFICQSCTDAIKEQLKFGISYRYAEC